MGVTLFTIAFAGYDFDVLSGLSQPVGSVSVEFLRDLALAVIEQTFHAPLARRKGSA